MSDLTNESLQVQCAEAVGWTIRQIEVTGMQDVGILPPGVNPDEGCPFFDYAGISLPDFPNSTDACQPLLEEARGTGWTVQIYASPTHEWDVRFWKGLEEFPRMSANFKIVTATDPSLPRAICIAFLRLKGVL